MNNIHIRDIRSDDTEDLLMLNESSVPHVNSVSVSDFEALIREACYAVVAETEGVTEGFLLAFDPNADYGSPNFLWFKNRYASFVYIDRIIIAPHARRKGVAWRLYNDLERYAIRHGIGLMTCEYNILPRNEESRLFHLEYGFGEAGTQKTSGGKKTVSLQVKNVDAELMHRSWPGSAIGPRRVCVEQNPDIDR